jgi:hypothetical protein
LRHVAPRAERRAAEEIANREKCEDFETFKPQIERVQADLAKGAREAKAVDQTEVTLEEVRPGNFFIVAGQMALIADTSDAFVTEYERKDRRVRVIYDNGTEATMLARSFQKALYRDETARRITALSAGPLLATWPSPTIWQAARSMFCAASQPTRMSPSTGN